ncbi:MAG: pyridoxamine 5'-phosphate oxidase family protein [Desulfofustis sp.]|jgi:heme iron utilization protein
MNKDDRKLHERIKALLADQPLAVLSTQRDGQPYASLMAYACTDDLKHIVVATGSSTRKHQNISMDARVALLVDNRSNSEEDFHEAAAVTIMGVAKVINDAEWLAFESLYLDRHPYLEKFLRAPTTTFFKIEVLHYLLVTRFQSVMEYHLDDENNLFP